MPTPPPAPPPADDAADAVDPATRARDRARFRVTLVRVLATQVVALVLLWLVQRHYSV